MVEDDPRIRRPSWIERIPSIGFIELFEKYRRRMVHRETHLPFDPTQDRDEPYTIERLAFETGRGLRLLLKVFFPICLGLFGLSFLPALPDLAAKVLRTCSVTGMIGFGTNWIAIKMLFWPRENRPVFGHGLIPSQRDELVNKVADEVLEKLINEKLILEKIHETRVVERFTDALIEKLRQVTRDPEFRKDLRNMILTYVGRLASDPGFRDKVSTAVEQRIEEFGGSSFRSWLVGKLRDVWRGPVIDAVNREIELLDDTTDGALGEMEGVVDRLPRALESRQEQIDRVLTKMLVGIVREVDIREIVLEQLSTVTSEQLEKGFREFADDKLSFITLLGGLLGLIGGAVIEWPLLAAGVICGLAVVLTILDVALYPLMRSRRWPRKEGHMVGPPPPADEVGPGTDEAGTDDPDEPSDRAGADSARASPVESSGPRL